MNKNDLLGDLDLNEKSVLGLKSEKPKIEMPASMQKESKPAEVPLNKKPKKLGL